MKVNKQQAKEILQQLSPQELQTYKQLNAQFSTVSEASVQGAVDNIVSNWRNWSTAMLMAVMMNPSIASAISKSAPTTYKEINTEISSDTIKAPVSQVKATSADFTDTFRSGEATLQNKDTLLNKLNTLKNWVQNNKTAKYKVIVLAGESQVTNPKEFEVKGSLAKARAELVKSLLGAPLAAVAQIQTVIGTTPYTKGKDSPEDSKYQAEQFVRVDIVVEAGSVCSLNKTDSGVEGTAANKYITFEEYVAGVGTISIKPGQKPDRLVLLDANGKVTKDTGYITTTPSRYKGWKYVPLYVLQLTKAHMTNAEATQGGSVKVITAKDYDDLKQQLMLDPNAIMSGTEIGAALVELQKLCKQGVTQFVIYDNMASGTLTFDQSAKDAKAVVYSPIQGTGYSLQGHCK